MFIGKKALKWTLVLVVLFGILWKTYGLGGDHVRAAWNEERATLETAHAQEIVRLVELQHAATLEYLNQSSHLKEQTKTLIKEVPVYVTKQDDANCSVPAGFVSLHDKAASIESAVPETTGTGGTVDTSSQTETPIQLSDVGRVVVENYGTCHETAEKLKALQNWAKKIGAQGP